MFKMRHLIQATLPSALSLMLLGAISLQAKVIKIEIVQTVPAFNGQTFGKTGAYELVRGLAYGELDPSDKRNMVITDIQLAPRNANGKVTYTASFSILKPVDLSKANGDLMYDVVNRGNPRFAARTFQHSGIRSLEFT